MELVNGMSSIGGIHTVLSPSWGHDVGLITLTLAKTVHMRVDQFLLWARLCLKETKQGKTNESHSNRRNGLQHSSLGVWLSGQKLADWHLVLHLKAVHFTMRTCCCRQEELFITKVLIIEGT